MGGNTWPNSCNLNLYTGGEDSVGWHADDEALFQGTKQPTLIISLSLGATRAFQLKGTWKGATIISILLEDGDLCTMEGMTQKHYLHRVPKEFVKGQRVNLTWRWIVQHSHRCASGAVRVADVVQGKDPGVH